MEAVLLDFFYMTYPVRLKTFPSDWIVFPVYEIAVFSFCSNGSNLINRARTLDRLTGISAG